MTSTERIACAQRVVDLYSSARTYRTMKDTAIRLARLADGQARKNLVMSARHSNRVMIRTLRRAIQEQAK